MAQVVLALFERRRQARLTAELAAAAEARRRLTDTVLDTIDLAVVAADPSGHLTLVNRAAREWHSLDADRKLKPAQPARHPIAGGRSLIGGDGCPFRSSGDG